LARSAVVFLIGEGEGHLKPLLFKGVMGGWLVTGVVPISAVGGKR
jgi:hypothetical protein